MKETLTSIKVIFKLRATIANHVIHPTLKRHHQSSLFL